MMVTNEMQVATPELKAPWIGVGKSGNWSSVEQAMQNCDLNFHVIGKDVKFDYEREDLTFYEQVPNVIATVRDDTFKPLGCVSSTYEIVQNQDVFPILQPFVDAGGAVTSAGKTEDGLCFMVVTMEQLEAGNDMYNVNIMATNSFNGRYPASLICSPVRIICQNMYRSLMNHHDSIARYRHSLNVSNKLNLVKAAYEHFNDYKGQFCKDVEKLKLAPAKHSIEEFVELMFPYTNTDINSSRYEQSRDNVDEKRAFYINRYYNSSTNSDFGTCFALVNAYYDYTSHHVPVRSTEESYRDRRLSSLVGGKMINAKLMSFMCEPK